MYYVQIVNGMLFLEVLELQVQYMIDRFQEWRSASVFKRIWIDGWMLYLYVIKRLELIGNDRLWMVPLQGYL